MAPAPSYQVSLKMRPDHALKGHDLFKEILEILGTCYIRLMELRGGQGRAGGEKEGTEYQREIKELEGDPPWAFMVAWSSWIM